MLYRLRQRSQDEGGFTLIELLVVILIIGILAAIAIPSFLAQKGKAQDSSAKELARTAQTTMETYATDNGGSYVGATLKVLHEYEPTIQTAAGNNNAYLSAVQGASKSGTPEASAYSVTATSTSEAGGSAHKFTIERTSGGEVKRTCEPTGKTGSEAGGCVNGTW